MTIGYNNTVFTKIIVEPWKSEQRNVTMFMQIGTHFFSLPHKFVSPGVGLKPVVLFPAPSYMFLVM